MPKFPDLLLNNNPNAPSIDLNDLQVKGVGIFADKAERDLLDANIQTEGYLAIMKDDDNLYVYIGGGWTTATNWVRVSGTLQVAEVDGAPIGDVSLLAFPPDTLTITGPIATVNLSGYATTPQLAALQTEVDNIETALGIEITGVAPPTDPGDILISDGTNFGVSVYSLPTTDGSAGQFLQTDGLGNVSFATISATLEGLTDTPVGYGTAGQILVSNGTNAFTLESVGLWDTVTYTGQTAIKYENGVVGIKASGTAYSTNTNLLAKAGQFPIDTGSFSANALMHLHEGRIIYTTDNSPTGATAMSLLGTTHATTDYGSIGLYDRKLWLHGGEGVYLGAAGNRSVLASSSSNSNILVLGSQSWDTKGGIQLDGDTGAPTNYMKIVMGGQIIFHGHTQSKYVAISRRGTYGTDGGVQMGAAASGLFANFAASDGNTPGSFGYLGINVDNPQASGPAFEVSSSYAKFNNGLHIGDITTTGYSFPTATGTQGQILEVDANGDLVFATASSTGADISLDTTNFNSNLSAADTTVQLAMDTLDDLITGQWTIDTNGINYQAGNVGIGTASSATAALSIIGRISLNDGSDNTLIGSAAGAAITTGSENVIIGNGAGDTITTTSQNVIIGDEAVTDNAIATAVAVGYKAGKAASGTNLVAIGTYSGYNATGVGNTFVGRSAGLGSSGLSTGTNNTFIGLNAGDLYTTGGRNTAVGADSAPSLTTGDQNVFIGDTAGDSVVAGNYNTILGFNAGNAFDSSDTVVIGHGAGTSATGSGGEHVLIGKNAGSGAVSGASVVIGSGSGTGTMGYGCVVIGRQAHGMASAGESGQNNIMIGKRVMYNSAVTLGSANIIIGDSGSLPTGSNNNVYIRGNGTAGIVNIGGNVADTGGFTLGGTVESGGVALGQQSKALINSFSVGFQSGASQTTGADGNIFIGRETGENTTTGTYNIALGYTAGQNNITGSKNVFIGYFAGQNETGSNRLYISNSNTATPLIYGEFDNDIVDLNAGVSITGSRTVNAETVGLDVVYNGALIGSGNNNGTTDFPATWEFDTGVTNGNAFGSVIWFRPGNNAQSFNLNYQSQIVNNGYSTHIIAGNYHNFYFGVGTSINSKLLRLGGGSVNATVLKVGPVDAPNFAFPSVDGAANQVIVTDGAGQGKWITSYSQKYESVATAKVGNSTQTETGTVAFVERYYTAKKDGDATASSSYTGAGTRRLFYAPKYNADPTKIENQDNPEGWILVNTGEQWTVDTYAAIGFGGSTPAIKHNLALDEETNTEANYISLLEEYIGHENYSDSAEVTFAVVVIPTVITINSGATGTYQFEFTGGSWGGELARIENGTTIDWGDGNVDTVTGGAILGVTNCEAFANHTYASTDTDYTITINGFVRSTYFDTDQQLKAIKMGTQLRLNQGVNFSAIVECYYLSSFLGRVFFLPTHNTSNTNMTPPSFRNCVRLNAVNMEHFFTPYQYPVWDELNSHTWYQPFKNVWSDYRPNCRMRTQQIQFAFQLEGLGTSYAADFTNGSPTVTRGAGLDFKIVEGRRIYVDNTVYTIQSIDSTTQLTLTSNFTGTTGSYNMDFDFSQKSSFTSFSNIELCSTGAAFYGGSPLADYDIDTFKKYEGGPYMGYLNTYLGVTTAPAYPKPITKFFANDTTKYISPGFVKANIGSTTIHAPSGWSSEFTIPTRPTFSVDCVNNTKNITMTSGDTDYRIQEGFGVEIDGNIYLVNDHTSPNTFTIATNFTSATGTYTLTVLTCPPVIIDGREYTVVSIDNVNNTAEIYPVSLSSGEYNIEFLGWRIGNGGGVRKYGFSFIKDPNPIIQNVDLSNVGTTAYTYQSATLFRSGKIVSPDLRGWRFPITPRSMRYAGNGGSNNQGLGYSFDELFYQCYNFNTNTLSEWDTKGVGDFNQTFRDCNKFNGDICSWDMSGAWRLNNMFNNANKFNQDISGWDTSRVREMNSMFALARDFNQPIGKWDVGNVRYMNSMFQNASGFNQDLSTWDTKNVRSMSYMFASSAGLASVYNPFGDLSSWDVSNVTNFQKFADNVSSGFANSDWDLGQWDIGSATNITYMFQSGGKFRPEYLQGLSNWDFTNVGSLESTFRKIGDMHLVDVSNWQIQNANIQGPFQYTNNNTYTAANGEQYKYCAPGIGFASWNNRLGSTTSLSSFMRFCASVDIYRYDMDVTNGSPTVTIQDPYIGAAIASEITTANKDHWQLVIGGVTYFISAVSGDFRTVTLTTNYTGSTATEKVTFKWVHNPDISGWDVSTIQYFGSAFEGVYLDRDISGWNLNACVDMSKAFDGLVDAQVAAALIGWNNNVNTPNAVTATLIFGYTQLVSATYPGAEAAYLNLTDTVANGGKGWIITGLSFI